MSEDSALVDVARPRFAAPGGLAQTVILAWGWRRRGIAFAGGAAGALAMPPVDFAPALIVPMTLAVWLIDGAVDRAEGGGPFWASLRAAFGAGWWWGFGYFVAGLWWLGSAFLVDADKFAWALPFGVLGLPAALAVFPGFGFALARLIWRADATRVLALAVGLAISEWLRCVVLTGFPWNELGMALGANLELAQIGSIVGLHGLTLAAAAIFAAPATLWTETRRRWLPTALAVAALAAIFAFGAWRLSAPASPTAAQRQVAADAAQRRAGQRLFARQRASDRPGIPRPFRPGDLAHDLQRRRRHPSDLAGIGLSLPARARRRGAGGDQRVPARRDDARHRRGAARRERPQRRPPRISSIRS